MTKVEHTILNQTIQLPYGLHTTQDASGPTATKARTDAPNYHLSAGLLVCKSCLFNDPEGTCNRFEFAWDEGFVCDDWQPMTEAERAADYEGDKDDEEKRRRAEAITTTVKGGMVALFLQDDAAKQLEAPGFDNPVAASDMHITLGHFEDDPTDKQMDDLKALLSDIASDEGGPISGKVEAVTTFPAGKDGTPLILLVDSFQLPALQQKVMMAVEAVGLDPSMDHGFIPHITLAYLQDDHGQLRQTTKIGTELTFDNLSLVADDRPGFASPFQSQRTKAGARHNRKDKGALQKIHDFTVSMGGAKCQELAARSVTDFQDLPLADRDRDWDGDAARQRIRKWAGGPDKEDVDLAQFRRGFFWRDDDDPESLTKSYKLPYADIRDGQLVAVPNGVIAVAGNLAGARGGVDISEADQETIKNQVSRYYAKMRKKFDDENLVPTWEQPERDEKTTPLNNALKAVSATDDQLIVENAIVLFGGRDLSGTLGGRENPDGSRGEFFTKDTQLESSYTKAIGRLPVDWEHSQYESQGEPGRHDILGFVDWLSAKATPDGLFVQRILDRRNKYVKILEELIEKGLIGTSSQAIPENVKIAADGEIKNWPLLRDTLTVAPMEPRMSKEFGENILAKIKALVDQGVVKMADGSKALTEGDGRPSRDQAKTITRLRLKSKQIELN